MSCELFIGPWWGTTHRGVESSNHVIDIEDAEAVSPSTSEFVRLSSRICDQVSDTHFGCSGQRPRELDGVPSHGKNGHSGVLYFTLSWRLLYGAGYTVIVLDTGFSISDCHVYQFQAGNLRYHVFMMQATRKQSSS